MMNSNEPTGVKPSAEEASLHDNKSSRDRYTYQPFPPDCVTLPMNVIIGSILPFAQDRSTWNNLCLANKELRDGGRTMTPPWPEVITCPPLDQNFGRATAFSPCGHYLACVTMRRVGRPSFIHILDRRHGQQTSLWGRLEDILCLSFSDDGRYLAAGGNDGWIRIWPTNSSRKPTAQGLKYLQGHSTQTVNCLVFASDSNLLASGSRDEIKLWNVEDGVCIHSFHHHHGRTISLVFTGMGESIRCWAATTEGSLIRISRNISLSEFVSDVIVVGAARFLSTAFSLCGSFLAKVDLENKLCLHEIETEGISMAQSVTLTGYPALRTNAGMAFSPDNKMLAILVDTTDEDDIAVLLIDVKDLTLQRRLGWKWRGSFPVSLAFDPSSRYLATLFYDGSVRLWSV